MKLGAVTYNVLKDWDVETIITKLEELGYEAVELRTSHKHGVEPSMSSAEREQVRKRFEASKVRLWGLGTVCEFHSNDIATRNKQIEIAKSFVDLAKDTGAKGVKVRPNGLPEDTPHEVTIANIASGVQAVGEYAADKDVEIWVEVHGIETAAPPIIANIMEQVTMDNVGVCWNSNPQDIVDGSVKEYFALLQPWIKSVHITELANGTYPWRELFRLLRESGYDRYTLCEVGECPQAERFLQYYRALWLELNRD